MFIPVLSPPAMASTHTQGDAVDLKVAIKLLSGTDCERDASQAQTMLLRLVESDDKVVAADAKRLVKAGVSNRWFTEKTPRHYELERIAEATLARLARNPAIMQTKLVLLVGVGLLVAGLLAFFMVSEGNTLSGGGFPVVAVATLVALLAVVFATLHARKSS